MPIIKSAIKRVRQAETRRSHNLVVSRAVKLDTRTLMDALEGQDSAAIETALRAAVSEIDRAVKKGVLHRNTAARRKSRLSKLAAAVVKTGSTKAVKQVKATSKTTAAKKPAKKPAAKKTTKK